MNSKLLYMYRDASNYKEWTEVILDGLLTKKQEAQITECLNEGEGFIPSQIGLEDLQPRMTSFPTDDDHVWHELVGFEESSESPNVEITPRELVRRFASAKNKWDISGAMDRLGLSF